MKPRQLSSSVTSVLVLGLATLAACSHRASTQDESANAPRPVRVAAVTTVPLDDAVRAVGLLGPKDEARLAFKLGGVIEAIPVEEGAAVKSGQVLAYLRQTEVAASVEQARQTASKAARDLSRAKALYADGVATEEQVQDLATAHELASATLRTAEFNSSYARIVAPAQVPIVEFTGERRAPLRSPLSPSSSCRLWSGRPARARGRRRQPRLGRALGARRPGPRSLPAW